METTRIRVGTPDPLYITAYGDDFVIDGPVRDMPTLTRILRERFLTEENAGAAFVAWNSNRFDSFIAAAALIRQPDLVLLPYLTKNKALRGLRVVPRDQLNNRNAKGWEFLDGVAMTGLTGMSLDTFTANFAPGFRKLTGAIDFEREEFDPENPAHRAYALRDSEGLYHAITRAQSIMLETFDQPLAVTMGGACIKVFSRHIPEGVEIDAPTADLRAIVSSFVMRGGFCYITRRYRGPVWKYDINQAYAAAMREADLPAGGAMRLSGAPPAGVPVYVVRVRARNPSNRVPFYHRSRDASGRVRSLFSFDEVTDTWITSIEHRQLISEGWRIECLECWCWGRAFRMRDYVDKLERLRTTCEGGPSGPIGTMIKATGNHSYGKTVENVEPVQYILAAEQPPECVPLYGDDGDPMTHVWWRIDQDRRAKAHHQPQLGAFITAHVRMVVRRAALVDPDAWLYADTDCVIFSRDVTASLDIDPKRYGAWKIEEQGAIYELIAKKVYTEIDPTPGKKLKRSAKGMNVKRLTADDFAEWYEGRPPTQDQVQLQNFLAVIRGAEMFRSQTREGTRVERADFMSEDL